jgi:hypothetical protein
LDTPSLKTASRPTVHLLAGLAGALITSRSTPFIRATLNLSVESDHLSDISWLLHAAATARSWALSTEAIAPVHPKLNC